MKIISYKDIIKATKEFSSENLVGSGSFEDVYKGTLEFEVDLGAIKVFNLNKHGGPTSFTAECEALNNIRHQYGMGGPISTKGDTYSYGVVLLEMLTGMRPRDEK
uniref:Serine-threonine/tyrosine-protein kinase catalytic domain-containing protein n=1 Tax=Oryza brachyantha TaxID=4533 RepID=J3LAU5_ORYBR